jgi:hypothetical protein
METTTHSGDGGHPDRGRPHGDEPHRDVGSSSAEVLTSIADRFAGIDASGPAQTLLAQVLAAAFMAFTDTRSVRDPLPETAPGSAEEALAVVAGVDHLRSSLAAIEATWQVAAEQRIRRADRERGLPASKQGKGASHELGLAGRISPQAASFSLASARRLVQNMPGMIDSLWDGSVAERQASTVAGVLDGASPATCAQIDQLIRENPGTLEGKGRDRLRSDIETMIQKLEPETSRERAERAARARHVTMTPLADGMARVSAVLRGIDAVGLMQALNTRAKSLKAAGERTPGSALEADLLVDAVLHPYEATPPAPQENVPAEQRRARPTPGLDVGIIITDTALLGRDDDAECARLEGYGTIPAHIVTDTLLGTPPGQLRPAEAPHPDDEVSAVFRRLYASPRKGELIAMESQARAFPTGLARMIRWRDSTCRTPWCNAKVRHIDHVVPYHRGGATSYANGQGLCVRCNLLKEYGLWVLALLSTEGPEVESGGAGQTAVLHRGGDPAEPRATAGSPPPSQDKPPAAWVWTSPHGAQGISPTPMILPPPDPPVEESHPGEEGLDPPPEPAPAPAPS